ncbi:MAG: hypothetical protein LBE01_04085 [Deltaproteobacteria bacterium]|nr:hypothetical protein [Deltaproteobacteria bacterium]
MPLKASAAFGERKEATVATPGKGYPQGRDRLESHCAPAGWLKARNGPIRFRGLRADGQRGGP